MNPANFLLKSLAQLTNKLPYHRKRTHFYVFLSKILMSLGAESIVIAKMKDETNITVDLRSKTERAAYFDGIYDDEFIQLIQTLIEKDTAFLDIGANIGFYSVAMGNFFRQHKFKGKIISFEPFIGNFNRLTNNIAQNNLDAYCSIYNFGLSDASKNLRTTLREDFSKGSSTGNTSIQINMKYDKNYTTVPISLQRLDDVMTEVIEGIDRIDIIKMDIEGHEDFCLKGAQQSLKKYRPTILMEVAKPYYKARKIDLDKTFYPLIPEDYVGYYYKNNSWTTFKTLEDCREIDNVFWIPQEKLDTSKYKMFIA